MSINLGSNGSRGAEMNVTPLVDVLLVLLIIFMVLPHHFGERVDIPQAKAEPVVTPEAPVVIHLSDNGFGNAPTVRIDRDTVTWESLESRLRDTCATKMQRVAFLRGDPEIDFQYIAQVVDMVHHAGVDHVGLLGAKD